MIMASVVGLAEKYVIPYDLKGKITGMNDEKSLDSLLIAVIRTNSIDESYKKIKEYNKAFNWRVRGNTLTFLC
jgi:hypothetical protein